MGKKRGGRPILGRLLDVVPQAPPTGPSGQRQSNKRKHGNVEEKGKKNGERKDCEDAKAKRNRIKTCGKERNEEKRTNDEKNKLKGEDKGKRRKLANATICSGGGNTNK